MFVCVTQIPPFIHCVCGTTLQEVKTLLESSLSEQNIMLIYLGCWRSPCNSGWLGDHHQLHVLVNHL